MDTKQATEVLFVLPAKGGHYHKQGTSYRIIPYLLSGNVFTFEVEDINTKKRTKFVAEVRETQPQT